MLPGLLKKQHVYMYIIAAVQRVEDVLQPITIMGRIYF